MTRNQFLSAILSTTLTACSSLIAPSASLIDTLPVVRVGEKRPAGDEHIVFIPADTDFPIAFSVKGSIFNHDVSSKKMVSLKQDLYLYQSWASLDGRTWVDSHELMDVNPSGGFDPSGGKVEVKINFAD